VHIVNLDKKPYFSIFKIKVTHFYIKHLADFISIVALLFTIFGSTLILLHKNPTAVILSNLGGFIGGMFTFIAVIYSLKEFLINKQRHGSSEYLSLINDILEMTKTVTRVSWKLGGYIRRPPLLNTPKEKHTEREIIKALGKELGTLKCTILTKYGSICFLNEGLGLRMLDDVKVIENQISVVTDSIDSICRFVTSKKHDSSLLDKKNAFIAEAILNDLATPTHLEIIKAFGRLTALKPV
tara:strand:+ start:42694 stop:43413 length:720 start_codon:yes stop_codon:yes gene_type:complete